MIDARTKLLALIGHPVHHSLSPRFQNAALQHLGLPFVYLAFDVPPKRLQEAVRAFRVLGVEGFNVTVPHKEAICPFLDGLEGEAAVLQAVNTVVHREGKLLGYNTDVYGFLESLRYEGVSVAGKTFLLFGAGGAAKSVLLALAREGASFVYLVNRTLRRAVLLGEWAEKTLQIPCRVLPWGGKSLPLVHGIINATSLGLGGEMLPIPWETLPSLEVVVDLVYRRDGTPLVREAQARGIRSFDGKRMLLYQGAQSFFLFTGVPAPLEVMEHALFGGS